MSIVIQNILLAAYFKISQLDPTAIFNKILPLCGILLLSNIIYKLGSDIFLFTLHESTLPRFLTRPAGTEPYALITGASDGIGRGCAEELLSRGFNVVLHGRNEAKLEGVKAEMLKAFPGRKIHLAVLDVTSSARDHAAIEALVAKLKADRVSVSVLVNNVGGMGGIVPAWLPLHLRKPEELDRVLDMNVGFAMQLTRAMLPLLFEAGPALVVNIGSVVGKVPSAYLASYSGAKAFINAWSRALRAEMQCEKRDVEVLCIEVGQVRAQHDRGEPTLWTPSSRRMGRAVCDVVGCGRGEVAAYWPHCLQLGLILGLPTSWLELVMIRLAVQKKGEEEVELAKGEKKD